MQKELEKGRQWSIENNDGNPNLAGYYFSQYLPRYIEIHEKSAKHFRRMAKRGTK
jgi:hypothetical protein